MVLDANSPSCSLHLFRRFFVCSATASLRIVRLWQQEREATTNKKTQKTIKKNICIYHVTCFSLLRSQQLYTINNTTKTHHLFSYLTTQSRLIAFDHVARFRCPGFAKSQLGTAMYFFVGLSANIDPVCFDACNAHRSRASNMSTRRCEEVDQVLIQLHTLLSIHAQWLAS